MLVGRVAPLGNDAFPTFAAGALPGLGVGHAFHQSQRRLQGQRIEYRAALVQRQRCQIAVIQP
jgi:hypothetical protein